MNNGTFDHEEYDLFSEFNFENEDNKEEIYTFDNLNEPFVEKSNNEESNKSTNNKINLISVNSFNNKKLTKKIQEFKEQVKILIKNNEKRNEKISIYLNSSERKKRKMRKELIKKIERMNLLLSKKNIQKRILQNSKSNNMNNVQLFQKNVSFTPIFQNLINIPIFQKYNNVQEKISFLGKKRIKF
jgi:hypothetical protein